MANTVKLIRGSDISKVVAKMDPVQDALKAKAERVAAAGKMLLQQHRQTGAHEVKYIGHNSLVEYGHIDHYAIMTGPAPISVEYGHRAKNGRWVHGLYIMTRAMFM